MLEAGGWKRQTAEARGEMERQRRDASYDLRANGRGASVVARCSPLVARAAMAVFVCLMVSGLPSDATVIELSEAAEITADRIELGALATVTGPEPARERLEALDIGPAPLPGRSRTLTLGYLKMRMRRWGLKPESFMFTGAPQVQVSRHAETATTEATTPTTGTTGTSCASSLQPPASSLRRTVVVKRGARLQLSVICGAVCILAEATTLEDGVVGQRVKMRVEQTRQTVWGTLLSPSTATLTRRPNR